VIGLHDHDPAFREISLSDKIRGIARAIGFHDPRMLQSMIICKQPEIGGSGIPPIYTGSNGYSTQSPGFGFFVYGSSFGGGVLVRFGRLYEDKWMSFGCSWLT
jgi:hypothetical protein